MIFPMLNKGDFIARCMNWIYSSGVATRWSRAGGTSPGQRSGRLWQKYLDKDAFAKRVASYAKGGLTK
jgi:hypothetical protein